MTDTELMAEMFRVLKSYPCRCQRKWDREMKEGFRIVHRCSNCIVQAKYLELMEQPA